MTIAGVVNMAMLTTSAAVFHTTASQRRGYPVGIADQLGADLAPHADTMFGVALLSSGLSPSSVGTLAGQVVMQGFIRRPIPVLCAGGVR